MAITNSDLTEGSNLTTSTDRKYIVTGDGVFDDMMEAVNVHLAAQFELGHIQTKDFTEVYLGSIQSSMSQAVAFLLGRDKTAAEIELIGKQIELVEAQIKAQVTEQSSIAAKTVAELVKQWGYPDAAVDEDGKVTTGDAGSDGLIDAQIISQINQGEDILNQTKTRDEQSEKDLEAKDAQIAKSASEVELLDQKTVSELAQTEDLAERGSVLGEQIILTKEQANGFYWNASSKWAKLTIDAASVDASQSLDGALCSSADVIRDVKPFATGSTQNPDSTSIPNKVCEE